MTAAPGMRDLAHRLLVYEDAAAETSEPTESSTLRVYEKLRQTLGDFVGVAGFQALAARALTLSKPDAPGLSAVRLTADGSLQGLSEIEAQFDIDKDQAGEAGIILIARLLGLLRIFLGEALTFSLLRTAWPGATLDDRGKENGRES